MALSSRYQLGIPQGGRQYVVNPPLAGEGF